MKRNKFASINPNGLRVEFDGRKGPTHIVIPLLLFPGTHKKVNVKVLPQPGISLNNSVIVGDAFQSTFSHSYSASLGGSFFATGSLTTLSGISEKLYEVVFLPDFQGILFTLKQYKLDTGPIGVQLAFPITNYTPDTSSDYIAEVKLEIDNKVIETYRIPRAVHPKAGRILLLYGHSKQFYEGLNLLSPKVPISGLRFPFLEISQPQCLSLDEIPAILKNFQGIHLLTTVDPQGIVINDEHKSHMEFFEKINGFGLKLIYIDTCNSVQVVSAFRHTDISALVAATQNLEINYADRFEVELYQSLGNGMSVTESFQRAVKLLSFKRDFSIRGDFYDPMFLDLKCDFRFTEEM